MLPEDIGWRIRGTLSLVNERIEAFEREAITKWHPGLSAQEVAVCRAIFNAMEDHGFPDRAEVVSTLLYDYDDSQERLVPSQDGLFKDEDDANAVIENLRQRKVIKFELDFVEMSEELFIPVNWLVLDGKLENELREGGTDIWLKMMRSFFPDCPVEDSE